MVKSRRKKCRRSRARKTRPVGRRWRIAVDRRGGGGGNRWRRRRDGPLTAEVRVFVCERERVNFWIGIG